MELAENFAYRRTSLLPLLELSSFHINYFMLNSILTYHCEDKTI